MDPSLLTETPTLRPPVHEGRPRGERQRQLLVALVSSNPGIHILRAASLLGLNWNTCLHHVRRLEGTGRLTVRKVNGRVCLFDRSAGAASHRVGDLMLRDGRNEGLARLLIESPGVNQKSLAGQLGIAASVVHYRLVRLEEAGLVQRVDHGRQVRVFATEALEAAYATHQRTRSLVPPGPEATSEVDQPAPAWSTPGPLPFDVDAPVPSP